MPYSGKEYQRKYRETHKEQTQKYRKKYYNIHKELCDGRSRRWRIEHPERSHAIWRKFKYKITEEEFNKILKLQNNKCVICRKSFSQTPVVDHNHQTGIVRGLLCKKCNFLLGLCDEDFFVLEKAVEYLRKEYTNIEKEGNVELVVLPPEIIKKIVKKKTKRNLIDSQNTKFRR